MRLSNSLLAVLGLSVVGCTDSQSEPEILTFEEFKAQIYQEPETGIFIVNGDEPVETEQGLQAVYESFVDSVHQARLRGEGYGEVDQGLIVNTVGGADDKWSATTAQNLTYCVSKKSFGSRHAAVVAALDAATAEWEAAANVNFVHLAALDGNCTNRTANTVFDVREVCRKPYLARAFFPSTSRRGREILIDCTSFGNLAPWTLQGVLRHELGHTLGFRHEHTRPDSGTCFENNEWRALTAYDSKSVMHYPQCNGSQDGDLTLTSSDRTGAGILYP
jgi:hypothetical protein